MKEVLEQDEVSLISEARRGNADAFRKIVELYQKRIYGYALATVRDRADASEITQDTFIRFYENMEQFDMSRPFAPYLFRIALNLCRDLIRKRARRTALFDDNVPEDAIDRAAGTSLSPLDEVIRDENFGRIRQLLSALPEQLREVSSLFYISECSCSEIAGALRISENSVKVSLHRARKKMVEIYAS